MEDNKRLDLLNKELEILMEVHARTREITVRLRNQLIEAKDTIAGLKIRLNLTLAFALAAFSPSRDKFLNKCVEVLILFLLANLLDLIAEKCAKGDK